MTGRLSIVIGGGIGGLVCARDLAAAGRRVVLLEAEAHLGGPVRLHEVGGIPLDRGAESFATANGAVADLAADLGIADRIVTPRPAGSWILNPRGAFPSPRRALLGIPADPGAADVRAALGDAAAERARRDRDGPPLHELPHGVSLGELVRERMGEDVVTHLVEPVVGGVHSAHPDLLEAASLVPRLPEALASEGSLAGAVAALRPGGAPAGAAVASLDGGLGLLAERLAASLVAHGGTILTASPVTDLAALSVILHDHLPPGTSPAEIVLAVPPDELRRLLAPVAPGAAARIDDSPRSPVRLATLVVDRPDLDAHPRGTGALVGTAGPERRIGAKALTHASAKWEHVARAATAGGRHPHRHVLRLSYGRSGGPLPDEDDLADRALADAAEILGLALAPAELVDSAAVTFEQALGQARPGHRGAVADVEEALAATSPAVPAGPEGTAPRLAIAGAWAAGTGLAAVTAHARDVAARLTART